ncbi:hypothetical protein BO94DRAFT_574597 [Aspergillus sclerotioniger CBS 115572]|uniref:Peptidase S8/S53 domain-containing protein n=1 Tax=Aspergillus sclerotioniger CBS 115572 TaxID=1450535 RepID=A0A317WTJ2_9EURO|nr:hypothetical protein BO94DRAFT_574597 [Aspergillus sclerotioniger CBS 115572]PWY89666.1 hypothetical protein BO94DRAFT_574597 [Aspergillus sclerotioniger CBS 115572]
MTDAMAEQSSIDQEIERLVSIGNDRSVYRLAQSTPADSYALAKKLPVMSEGAPEPMKAALLDSGIELSTADKNANSREPTIVFKDWVKPDNTAWRDDNGHGTHLAAIFRKVAPHAALYVARVYDQPINIDTSEDRIAEAIMHATDEWNVNMIIMPWGYTSSPSGRSRIAEALRHAKSKGGRP